MKDVEKVIAAAMARAVDSYHLKMGFRPSPAWERDVDCIVTGIVEALAEAEAEERQAPPTPRLRFEGPPCDPHFEVNPPEQPAELPPTPKSYWR